jgi:hypothetical protein
MKARFVELPITIDVGCDAAMAQELVKLWNTSTAIFAHMQELGIPTDRVHLVGLMLFARAKSIQGDLPVELAWLNLIASEDHKLAFEAAFRMQREFFRLLADEHPIEGPPLMTH